MANPNWVKGVSGNPGGRPKEVMAVVALARQESLASIMALVRIRDESGDPKAVVAAANAILDRGLGKPAQNVDVNVRKDFTRPREMTAEELRERREELLAQMSPDAEPQAH